MSFKLKSSLLKKIAKKYNLVVLILFGSRASENYNLESDLDFAFYSFNELDINLVDNLKYELSNAVKNDKLDLIDLNRNFNVILRKNIFFEGKCIYEFKKGVFDNLQNKVYFEYLDFKPILDQREIILKKKLMEI